MTDKLLSIEVVEHNERYDHDLGGYAPETDRHKAVAEAKELLSLRKRQPEYLINHTVYDALLQRLVN